MEKIISKASVIRGSAVALFVLALAIETLGSENHALNLIKKAMDKFPQNRTLHLHASRLYLKKGQVDSAVIHWKKAVGSENIGSFLYWLDNSQKHFLLSGRSNQINEELNGPDKLSGTIRKWPVKQQPLNDMGLSLLERGYVSEALQVFLKDLQKGKEDPSLLFNIGLSFSKLNRHEEALEYYERAQSMGLNNPGLLNNKGYSLFSMGRFEEALTCYELARGLAPNDYIILNNLAACYLKNNQLDRAENCFNAAVKNNPGDATLENNLAMCLETMGKTREAINHYDKALFMAKNIKVKKKILFNKIICLIKLKSYHEALAACDSMPHDDSEFEIWGMRAELLNELGRIEEAAESYRKAMGLTG
ncbi:tetratricopeptide repeat protein [Desulfallas sp. Bu1-1]|uniref:tetratricopeptide repeat protein n=1 Tax=Desulfallas sp. Bu1-1 TaxID=2787620 RepID=UPI00189D67F4|nr:tetratricopeptide repeat protein [Desulfallas sp. Bu1-1]MBF7083321.1 tetratricopeptide repeat protein [Desulfallas sp. Bu1-1]